MEEEVCQQLEHVFVIPVAQDIEVTHRAIYDLLMAAVDLHSSNITGQKIDSSSKKTSWTDKLLKHLSHTYHKQLPAELKQSLSLY